MCATASTRIDAVDLRIHIDDLNDPRIAAFLDEHIKDMRSVSPPESKHALDLAGLKKPDITFWSVWRVEEIVGCAALKRLDAEHAELKSMRISTRYRRQGIGAYILNFVLTEARQREYRRVSLETGSMPFFAPARALYRKHGFKECGPFADYKLDPNSAFLTREL